MISSFQWWYAIACTINSASRSGPGSRLIGVRTPVSPDRGLDPCESRPGSGPLRVRPRVQPRWICPRVWPRLIRPWWIQPWIRPWQIWPRVWPWQIPPRVRPRQIQPQVRQIQPQVLTSNFLLALVPGSGPGLDTGSGPRAGHRVRTPGWTLREQDYIFASNFFNNGPILINFISFESSWSPLFNGAIQ